MMRIRKVAHTTLTVDSRCHRAITRCRDGPAAMWSIAMRRYFVVMRALDSANDIVLKSIGDFVMPFFHVWVWLRGKTRER